MAGADLVSHLQAICAERAPGIELSGGTLPSKYAPAVPAHLAQAVSVVTPRPVRRLARA